MKNKIKKISLICLLLSSMVVYYPVVCWGEKIKSNVEVVDIDVKVNVRPVSLTKRDKFLRLHFNENQKGPSPKVLEAIGKAVSRLPIYPSCPIFNKMIGHENPHSLLKDLSRHFNVSTDELLVTNGSSEGIKLIISSFVKNGDEAIVLNPSFVMLKKWLNAATNNVEVVNYDSDNFDFPKEKVLKVINDETKMIILVTPNNPTGTIIDKETIIEIIEKNKDMIVVLDEAYAEFAGINNVDLVKKYSNVFVTRTFSKAYGLASLRLGYVVSQKQNIDKIKKLVHPFSVNSVSIAAGAAAIEDQEYLREYVSEVKEAREFLQRELSNLGFKTYHSAANFLLVNVSDKAEEIVGYLKKNMILVGKVKFENKIYLRITIGSMEDMKELVGHLKCFI